MSYSRPLRVVFDTSVYLAGLLAPDGYAAKYLYEAGLHHRYTIYTSMEILVEVKNKYAELASGDITAAISLLSYVEQVTRQVEPEKRLEILHDEPDNRILECAEACQADLIVSFDKHLLGLKNYAGAAIIHPSLLQDYFPR